MVSCGIYKLIYSMEILCLNMVASSKKMKLPTLQIVFIMPHFSLTTTAIELFIITTRAFSQDVKKLR